MRKWHTTLCEICIRTGSTKQFYYEKWGLYVPERRFDVDQSPMPFAQDTGKTYEIVERSSRDKEKRKANIDGKVWCAQPKAGDSKQFCSLNICFRPRGKQPRLAIIFRGKGKRINEVEKLLWDPDVDVYFQVNARVDTESCHNFAITLRDRLLMTSHLLLIRKAVNLGMAYQMLQIYGNLLTEGMLPPSKLSSVKSFITGSMMMTIVTFCMEQTARLLRARNEFSSRNGAEMHIAV